MPFPAPTTYDTTAAPQTAVAMERPAVPLPLKKRPEYRPGAPSLPDAAPPTETVAPSRPKKMKRMKTRARRRLAAKTTTRADDVRVRSLDCARLRAPARACAQAPWRRRPLQVWSLICKARSRATLARSGAPRSASVAARAHADAAAARDAALRAVVDYTHNALKRAAVETPSLSGSIGAVAVGKTAFLKLDAARDKLAPLHTLLAAAGIVVANVSVYVCRYVPVAKRGNRCDVRPVFELHWGGELLAKVGSCGRRKREEKWAGQCIDFPLAREDGRAAALPA